MSATSSPRASTPRTYPFPGHSSECGQSQLHIPTYLNFLAPIIVSDSVRIGRHYDGGYVIPLSVVKEADSLISLGISDDWSFDAHFMSSNPRVNIYAYDHTISGKIFFKQILFSSVDLLFRDTSVRMVLSRIRVWLSYMRFFTGQVRHFQQRLHNRIDSARDVTLHTVLDRSDSNKVFVKMDIEGGEYRIVRELAKHSSKIIGMVVEFHDTEPLRPLFIEAINMLRCDYHITHIHANNYGSVAADGLPEVLEITFVRKDRCTSMSEHSVSPDHYLDAPNDPSRADYILKFNM